MLWKNNFHRRIFYSLFTRSEEREVQRSVDRVSPLRATLVPLHQYFTHATANSFISIRSSTFTGFTSPFGFIPNKNRIKP